MVNILAFPGLKGVKPSKEELSASVTDMPRITATSDGGFVISQASPGGNIAQGGDWTNQELADLYRVEAMLVQANMRVSTGRGVSDEGEPWFVFCKEDGDVFVHLARIDGTYLLDSPGLGNLLQGGDFSELISRFVAQVAARASPGRDNVVTLRPRMLHDQTVRLHPAVMLAALVWSLYLVSDDFVGAAHAMEEIAAAVPPSSGTEHAAGDMAPEIALSYLSDQAATYDMDDLVPPQGQAVPLSPADGAKPGIAGDRSAGSHGPSMPVSTQGVAASLAVIAVSYGFFHLPDADDTRVADKTQPQKEGAATHAGMQTKVNDLQAVVEGNATERFHAERHKDASHDVKIIQPDVSLPVLKTVLTEEIRTVVASSAIEASTPDFVEAVAADMPIKIAVFEPKAAADSAVSVMPQMTMKTAAMTVTEMQSVLKLVSQYVGSVADYRIGNLTVSATLDTYGIDKVFTHIGETELQDFTSLAAVAFTAPPSGTTTAASLGSQYGYYDDRAKEFVSQFIREAHGIEMVQFNSEIVLVDMSAIDEATDVAYTLRWVTDDGHIISTIGHLQDFLDYGIA